MQKRFVSQFAAYAHVRYSEGDRTKAKFIINTESPKVVKQKDPQRNAADL